MRSLISFIIILFVQQLYAQEIKDSISYKAAILKAELTSDFSKLYLFDNDVYKFNFIENKLSSERKFSMNQDTKALFNEYMKNAKINKIKNQKLEVVLQKELIEKIIIQKLKEHHFIQENEALSYGDRVLLPKEDLEQLKNKFLISREISKDIQLDLGKSIYPDLNKILKTELDKTLQNSINLLAISF